MSMGVLWAVLIYTWIAGEIVITVVTRTRRGQGDVRDRGTMIINWVVIVLSFVAGGWISNYHATPMPFRTHGLQLTGLVLFIAGLTVRGAAIFTLGRSFSANVAIHSTQTIQRKGLYRAIRHPSYLGMEIIFLAAGLHGHSWAGLAAYFIPPTLAVLYRIHVEETALLSAFGGEYADYMKTTKRLVPGVY